MAKISSDRPKEPTRPMVAEGENRHTAMDLGTSHVAKTSTGRLKIHTRPTSKSAAVVPTSGKPEVLTMEDGRQVLLAPKFRGGRIQRAVALTPNTAAKRVLLQKGDVPKGAYVVETQSPRHFLIYDLARKRTKSSKGSEKGSIQQKMEAESKEALAVEAPEQSLSGQQLMDSQRLKVAETVQNYSLTNVDWSLIKEEFGDAELFAIESAPTSYSIDDEGAFKGRARLLIDIPRQLRSGRSVISSATIPARIEGTIDESGVVKLSEFVLGLAKQTAEEEKPLKR